MWYSMMFYSRRRPYLTFLRLARSPRFLVGSDSAPDGASTTAAAVFTSALCARAMHEASPSMQRHGPTDARPWTRASESCPQAGGAGASGRTRDAWHSFYIERAPHHAG